VKTVTLQVKRKQQKLPKAPCIGATVRLFDSHRDNLVRKVSVLYLEVIKGRKDYSWLESLLSGMRTEPHGFEGVALDKAQVQKVFALWFKQFGCLRCKKGGIHAREGVCIRCEGSWKETAKKSRAEAEVTKL